MTERFLKPAAFVTLVLMAIGQSPRSEAQTRTPSQASAARPEFEVAAIKPNTSENGLVMIRPPAGGRFTATNVNLKMLIGVAYKMRIFDISGGPAWANMDRYDITAKAEINPTDDQFRQMLQAMLEDRFKLMTHRETKEMPVYALLPTKNGPKLPEAREGGCITIDRNSPPPPPPRPEPGQPFKAPPTPCGGMFMMPNRMEGGKITMAQLVNGLTNILGRPVIDKTGFTGTFDVHLEFTPEGGPGRGPLGPGGPGGPGGPADAGNPLPPVDSSAPSIFTALQEQLGLRLESQKGQSDILIIDHAEKPTEN